MANPHQLEDDELATWESQLKLRKYEQRQKMTLLRQPLTVLVNFLLVVFETIATYGTKAIMNPLVSLVGLPLLICWYLLSSHPGSWSYLVSEVNLSLLFMAWWLVLGIASSIGLGTGMHSGLLFLFPHIYMVCRDADACRTLAFDTRKNVFWNMAVEDSFECVPTETGPLPAITAVTAKVFWACFFWGTGTAIGEIPPYAVSRAAQLAGECDKEFEDLLNAKPSSQFDVVGRMKVWMVGFLQRHGFLGVLLMSAWPNAFFDLCGICCGHFLMPFIPFFLACWIGKALIKVNMQALFFIMIFRDSSRTDFLNFLEYGLSHLGPFGNRTFEGISKTLHTQLDRFRGATDTMAQASANVLQQQHQKHFLLGGKFEFSALWHVFVAVLLGYFLISCVEQFARQRKQRIDNEEIASLVQARRKYE